MGLGSLYSVQIFFFSFRYDVGGFERSVFTVPFLLLYKINEVKYNLNV